MRFTIPKIGLVIPEKQAATTKSSLNLIESMKKIDLKEVLLKIRNKRVSLGFSQQYVAEKMKSKQNTYSKIEKGETRLTVDTINKIAEIFDCDSLELLDPTPLQDKHNILVSGEIQTTPEVKKIIDSMKKELEQSKELIQLFREREKWAKEKEELEQNIANYNSKKD